MPGASFAEWRARLRERLVVLWRTKLCLTVALGVGFWVPYLLLARFALLPVRTLPMTWLDQWAGFEPRLWSWVYESNFLITAIVPWLITSRDTLRRYVMGFSLMAGVSFVIFLLFPVASPRPANLGSSGLYLLIARVDGSFNAFPSLHAASLVYTLALAYRMFGNQMHPVTTGVLLIWGCLILFATLATKQHYAADLLAGGVIGWVADWFSWRHAPSAAIAAASTRRNVGITSQAG